MIEVRPYQTKCLNAMETAAKNGVTRQLIVMATGCHRAGQELLMADGSLKRVENIRVGDALMGPDSKPRIVHRLVRGRGNLYRISPVKGAPFVVDGNHMLTLVKTKGSSDPRSKKYKSSGQIVDVPVTEWLTWGSTQKHLYKLFRVGVEFQVRKGWMPSLSPYFLGIYLGDGSSRNGQCSVSKPDYSILKAVRSEARRFDMRVRVSRSPGRCPSFYILPHSRGGLHPVRDALGKLGLLNLLSGERFIPKEYKTASRGDRLELLAGLIDTDGSLISKCYDFISKSKRLTDDVVFLARSLGFAAKADPCQKYDQNGSGGTYYRTCISGDGSVIPCRIQRKRSGRRLQKKDVLRTGFSVRAVGRSRFYGFTVSGDGRYLMDDFTVTHNCGKTVVIGKFLERMGFPNTYGMMHRNELIGQARDRFHAINPIIKIGFDKAELHPDVATDRIILATVQSVGHVEGKRLAAMPKDWPKIIWLDESHHSASESWLAVLDHFGVYGDSPRRDVILIGTTATPDRLDELGYDKIFDDVVFRYGLRDGIKDGWLSDIKAWRVESGVDLSMLQSRKGDFVERELDEVMNTGEHNKLAVEVWAQHCRGRRSLLFCVTKDHARKVCDALKAAGGKAEVVVAETDPTVRENAIDALREGKLEAIVNCSVFTEGFDLPEIDCIHILRPTKSRALYSQMIGRGSRKASGKPYMELFDHTGQDHDVCSVGQIFGLPDSWELKGQMMEQDASALEEAVSDLGLSIGGLKGVKDLQERLRSRERRMELIKGSLTAADLPSKLLWVRPSPLQDRYVISWRNETREEVEKMRLEYQFAATEAMEPKNLYGISERIEVWKNELGKFEGKIFRRKDDRVIEHPMGSDASLSKLVGRMESWIVEMRPHKALLMKKSAKWGKEPASGPQIGVLKRKGIPSGFLEGGITKREASILMGIPRQRVRALFGEGF
jgi:superfamily II DNA or RNA helicase